MSEHLAKFHYTRMRLERFSVSYRLMISHKKWKKTAFVLKMLFFSF